MSVKAFAAQLKETIEDVRASGTAAIYCDNLITYQEEVINSPSAVVTEAELEKYKAELQVWIEQSKGSHLSKLEMFRSVIQAGQNAIRSSFLLNGGATVAMLAFIGKLTDSQQDKIPQFAQSLTRKTVSVLTFLHIS